MGLGRPITVHKSRLVHGSRLAEPLSNRKSRFLNPMNRIGMKERVSAQAFSAMYCDVICNGVAQFVVATMPVFTAFGTRWSVTAPPAGRGELQAELLAGARNRSRASNVLDLRAIPNKCITQQHGIRQQGGVNIYVKEYIEHREETAGVQERPGSDKQLVKDQNDD